MTNTKLRMKDTKIYNQKGTYIRASILPTGVRINTRGQWSRTKKPEVNLLSMAKWFLTKKPRYINGGKMVFQQMVQWSLDVHYNNTKINYKWVKSLSIRAKSKQRSDFKLGKDKLNFLIKIKNICASKDRVKKVKGQRREKTSANHISCKGLVFQIIS